MLTSLGQYHSNCYYQQSLQYREIAIAMGRLLSVWAVLRSLGQYHEQLITSAVLAISEMAIAREATSLNNLGMLPFSGTIPLAIDYHQQSWQ
jgi:hypothetical protein